MKELISWVEIPAVNIERAVNFYSTVFKLNLQVAENGVEKMACFPHGGGAISFSPGFKPSTDGVLISFNTFGDLEGTIEKVIKEGGRVLKPKTKIEAIDKGCFALIVDSEGNRLGLYSDS